MTDEVLSAASLHITQAKMEFSGYCNAGHNAPLLVRTKSEKILCLTKGGPAFGRDQAGRYREVSIQLEAGDRIAAFTRGVVESWRTPTDSSAENALSRVLQHWDQESAREIANALVDYQSTSSNSKQVDKVAVVASLKRTALFSNNLHFW